MTATESRAEQPQPEAEFVNRYLTGAFAPVDEEVTAFDLPVEGEVPEAVDGWYLRNGPNPISPDPRAYHWFTGAGMLHGIELSGGKARSYRNRWVRSDQTAAALGEKPIAGQVDDTIMSELTGNVANTNIVAHAGKLLALVEVNLPTEVNCNLDTVGRFDFGGRLRSSMTAHPHTDPVTGEMCFFGYEVVGPPYLRYHVADAEGALVHSAEITVPKPTMMHDFAITETRAIFMDLPVVFDLDLLGHRPFPAAWAPDNGARIGVMPRRGTDSDVIWCDLEPCYVFHVLNAFDSGDNVVLDVCRYETMFNEDLHGVGGGPARLERWTVSPSSRKVSVDLVSKLPVEFPRPDERYFAREHRFGFFSSPRMTDGSLGSASGMALAKVDLRTGGVEVHDFGPGAISGEGVFVPASADAAEGEGYVISIVADAAAKRPSDLVVLDATDFTAAPLATVHLPARVPLGFHGNFVPRGALAR
ncbi:MAG: carotenoid oxygenase family protein [Acidimicrobiales bacterium]